MNQADAIRLAKERSAEVPAGARARVWKRLSDRDGARSSAPVWAKGLAFAACAAAGFAIVSSLDPPAAARLLYTAETSIAVTTGDVIRNPDGVLQVVKGQVLVSSWGAPPVEFAAGPHRIVAEAALFSIDVAAQMITVDVREGEVRVDGERVEAGRRWPAGQSVARDFSAVTLIEPARAPEDRGWALAESALQQGDYPQALQRFDALGGGGLRAEAALLKKGELQLRQLSAPAAALTTFDAALARFPTGSLTQEIALSSLEATLALENWSGARTRAKDFLSRFPQNERLLDVRYVSALAAWQLLTPTSIKNEKAATCAEIRALQPSALNGERRETLEKLIAQCTLFER